MIAPGISYTWGQSCAPPSADSFLLADFALPRTRGKVCDLCCGAGLISLLLCARGANAKFTCGDVDLAALDFCRHNADAAGFADRINPLCCDVNRWRGSLSPESFDTVVCNPPYHEAGGKLSENLSGARSEIGCSIEAVCDAAGGILKNGGRFFVCMKSSRLFGLADAMRRAKIEPKKLRFVSHGVGYGPYLVLCEGIKSAAPGIEFLPELKMTDKDGHPTEEAHRIYYWSVI